jgi:SET domain-containing protein
MKPRITPEHFRFAVCIARSGIHRWGLFASQYIPANRLIMEYTGELIGNRKKKERERKRRRVYLWTINSHWALGGAIGGSGAEYVNHSCDPNLFVRFRGKRVFYYSLRRIRTGEELLIDYNFDSSEAEAPCRCGAKTCRGTINAR